MVKHTFSLFDQRARLWPPEPLAQRTHFTDVQLALSESSKDGRVLIRLLAPLRRSASHRKAPRTKTSAQRPPAKPEGSVSTGQLLLRRKVIGSQAASISAARRSPVSSIQRTRSACNLSLALRADVSCTRFRVSPGSFAKSNSCESPLEW